MRSVQCCTSDWCLSQCECECECECECVLCVCVCVCGVCVCVCVCVCVVCVCEWWWWGGGQSSVIRGVEEGEGGQGREGVQLPDSLVDEAVFQSVLSWLGDSSVSSLMVAD